jgi:hypothetical protein
MDDYFANNAFLSWLPQENCIVSLLIDGINVDEMVGVDDDVLPHQFTGLCRHCLDTAFNDYDDAVRIQDGLASGQFCMAKEAEVFAIGFNHKFFTGLIPVAISPTCKKDDIVGESTDTVQAILTTIQNHWHQYPVSQQYIMSTYNSDGAGQFRKAVGKVLCKDLPTNIRDVYIGANGERKCPLLNLVGGRYGTTASCDNDHLGKRFRARIKTSTGISIGQLTFTKTDLASLLQMTSIVQSETEVRRLFHPVDLMDVNEMVRCLYSIWKRGTSVLGQSTQRTGLFVQG